MTEDVVRNLVKKFFGNQCTPEEKEELALWIEKSANDTALKNILEESWRDFEPSETISESSAQTILSAILIPSKKQRAFNKPASVFFIGWKRLAVAGLMAVVLGTSGYLFLFNRSKEKIAKISSETKPLTNDANPGLNGASLILADGSEIILDTFKNGVLASQGGTDIFNSKGELSYINRENENVTELYNTVKTDRGELYSIRLSDGSVVWLNSASAIRFPVAFTGTERVVDIKGEAYFEIAKDPLKPFKVKVNEMEVRVLGTHFNVNAYPDEATIKTTLIEGSVQLTQGSSSLLLLPGQQAGAAVNGLISIIKDIDIEEVVSWKDGYFHFQNASLETVMHQLSRWYDVDVVYEDKIHPQRFGGDIDKNQKLSQVLKILEKSQVRCKIEGNQLIVLH